MRTLGSRVRMSTMTNTYTIQGDAANIAVWDYKAKRNRICTVDAADLALVSSAASMWTAIPARRSKRKWYCVAKVWDAASKRCRSVFIHRLIMGLTDPAIEVDHRDNDGLNNRWSNLRPCTHQENHRFRNPKKKDWAALDNARTLVAARRDERKIAAAVATEYGLTRQGMFKIRTEQTLKSPAVNAYFQAIRAAGIKSYLRCIGNHPDPNRERMPS